MQRRGNCYYASEALWRILGGKSSGWRPMRVKEGKFVHWFLRHKSGVIIDPSVRQFRVKGWAPKPDYSKAKGAAFLTGNKASKEAKRLITSLTWYGE